jgi:predicted LPLAT superfamily acyltransferase
MVTNKNHENDTNQGPDVSRFGVFGDFPTRLMYAAIRATPRMPFFIEAALLYFFSFVVFALAGSQRRAVRRNLHAIWDDMGWVEANVGVFRVFVNFGWTYIDGMRTRLGHPTRHPRDLPLERALYAHRR